MALSLYRRHRRDCKAGDPEEFHSGEFDEKKKGWKRCACPIFASGTFPGRAGRRSTGRWEWDDAKAIAETWERAGAWDGTPPPPAVVPDEPAKPARISIADAVKVFLTSREGAKIAPATLRKYRTFAKQLTDFTDGRGYVMLDQVT
jgi:hypothetical protein